MQREDNSASGEDHRRRPSAFGGGHHHLHHLHHHPAGQHSNNGGGGGGDEDDEFVDILHVQQRIFGNRRHLQQTGQPQPQTTGLSVSATATAYQTSTGYLYNVPSAGILAGSSGVSATITGGTGSESDWFTRWFNNAATTGQTLLPGEYLLPFYLLLRVK